MKKEIKNRTIRRLKIVEGQIRGLQRMVEDGKYCVDIIIQSMAIKEALSGVESLVLDNHLSTHVTHSMRHGDEKKSIRELLKIYKLSKKY